MRPHRIVHIRSVPPRPKYWVCRGTNLSHTFLYTTWDHLAGPILAPHTTRFAVRSDERLNSKYGLSATGAERPILVPSNFIFSAFTRRNRRPATSWTSYCGTSFLQRHNFSIFFNDWLHVATIYNARRSSARGVVVTGVYPPPTRSTPWSLSPTSFNVSLCPVVFSSMFASSRSRACGGLRRQGKNMPLQHSA